MSVKRLSHSAINALYELATTCQLEREGLLAGLDPGFVAHLRSAAAPGPQIHQDLHAINVIGCLNDGTDPLRLWLHNAIALSKPRPESARFVAYYSRLFGPPSEGNGESKVVARTLVAGGPSDRLAQVAAGVAPQTATRDARGWRTYLAIAFLCGVAATAVGGLLALAAVLLAVLVIFNILSRRRRLFGRSLVRGFHGGTSLPPINLTAPLLGLTGLTATLVAGDQHLPALLASPIGNAVTTANLPLSTGEAAEGSTLGFFCRSPYFDCDNDSANGCEVDLSSDVRNCGECGAECRAGSHQHAECIDGACRTTCISPYVDCDKQPENGCEVDPTINSANCGSCAAQCQGGPYQSASCINGRCMTRCSAPHLDCDADRANGCEVDSATDSLNCGSCNAHCVTHLNEIAFCISGTCRTVCATPYLDCDGDNANGCEIDSSGNLAHCGACNSPCVAGPDQISTCLAGRCSTACVQGHLDCDGAIANGCEINSDGDLHNCGACGHDCTAGANQTVVCAGGACKWACIGRSLDCDRNSLNGCEVDPTTDRSNCGACGAVCTGRKRCINGQCRNPEDSAIWPVVRPRLLDGSNTSGRNTDKKK